MKDYKRLTERDVFGNADIIGLSTEKLYSELCFSETNLLTKALNKLAELEDKIENGEIDYVADRDKEIARLTAENAELRATLSKMETVEKELRARLDKAVELPCKVGDTVYEKGMYEGDVYEHGIRKIIFDAEKISFDCTAIGNSIFLTRTEAEARLKEIKEKNDD